MYQRIRNYTIIVRRAGGYSVRYSCLVLSSLVRPAHQTLSRRDPPIVPLETAKAFKFVDQQQVLSTK